MRSETFERRDSIMPKAGVAVVTGALLLSMAPLPALAESTSSSSGSSTATSDATSASTGNVFLDIWNAIVDFFTGR